MSSDSKARQIIYPGKGPLPDFTKGTKATFDFKTIKRLNDGEEITLDDSKAYNKPMEILIGKQFKMSVWEELIKSMRVGEISKFVVDKRLVTSYPFIAKAYRSYAGQKGPKKEGEEPVVSSHCCGMAMKQGTGHPDLDDLIKNPVNLEFVIELVKVEPPDGYEKEIWQMEGEEQVKAVPRLREEGNLLYREGKTREACEKYGKALSILEQLLLKEKPGEEEWKQLDALKVPLLANYSQCKLLEKDYYAVIEHSGEVLKRDANNVKALFRRAKAHASVWNVREAREDFDRVAALEPSLLRAVQKEVKLLEEAQKEKDLQDKAKLRGKLF